MPDFVPGQRWISETEPELGLGLVESASRHQVRLVFPAANEARLYAPADAPIKRVEFQPGDAVHAEDGASVTVHEVREENGLLTYVGDDGATLPESELADTISFSKPEERIVGGRVDPNQSFALRYESLRRLHEARSSDVAGFAGGRIDLIPHQLYIASEVADRYLPRVLLADEVGLGKTIEACLILHRLHLTGRAERILVLVPEHLIHQWFVELLRRFNLWFTLIDREHCEAITAEDPQRNPFLESQLALCGLKTLTDNPKWAQAAIDADWEMLVVDEAHHLEWRPDAPSREYQLVEQLTDESDGLLLLTATPEQLGAEGHFARLRLLDPDRYPSLERFQDEQRQYRRAAAIADKLMDEAPLGAEDRATLRDLFEEYAEAALEERFGEVIRGGGDGERRRELLRELIDRHGTGRVIFRNTREALSGFPERHAAPAPLAPRPNLEPDELRQRLVREFDLDRGAAQEPQGFDYRRGPRIRWLAELIGELRDEKLLLICRTAEKARAIQTALREETSASVALFHEELTLLQRDRNAAWFSDPEGARILVCSEIGSEGRNFQFAHHLVLFDLPLDPELLEQRIGRLDRIGQSKPVHIHIPHLEDSCLEFLMRWHHEGLDGIEHSLKGGSLYLDQFGDRVRDVARQYHEADPANRREADALIRESKAFREEQEQRLRDGQDRLVALNSFDARRASGLVEQIRELDDDSTAEDFMQRIFDHFGVAAENIGPRTYRLSRGHLFTDAFPALPEDGAVATFDRPTALAREDIDFLTWDHPMVRGAIDLLLGSEQGNSSIAVLPEPTGSESAASPLLVEAIFMLESVAPLSLHVDRFLPPTPIRVVVDMSGNDCGESLSHETINARGRDEDAFRLRQQPQLLQSLVPEMLRSAEGIAGERKSAILESALQEAHARLDGEAARLKELRKVNPNVRDDEIELAEQMIERTTKHIAKAHLRLDAVRLVLRGEPSG